MKKELSIWFSILLILMGLMTVPWQAFAQTLTGTLRTMSFRALFAGSLTRDAHSKAADWVSIKDFGAKGDGVTDDKNAFIAAIAASSLTQCIYVPDAVYAITDKLTSDHPICFTGRQWRLLYTGGSTVDWVLGVLGQAVVWGPNQTCGVHAGSCYGTHTGYFRGLYIDGAIFDGQGKATTGLTLQGVISGNVIYSRATNVIDAGFMCNWCQQITFDQVQVSSNYEAFTTVPKRCLVIDNISSANTIKDINCEHVSEQGIDLVYALNTGITGGTAEGIGQSGSGHFGIKMWGNNPAPNPNDDGTDYHYNINNVITLLDLEENNFGGDISCGENCYYNTFYSLSSFSNPGVTLFFSAHENSFYGGTIGTGSSATIGTSGNLIRGVSVIDISCGAGVLPPTPPCVTVWQDNGFNDVGPIYNQYNNNVVEPRNQNNTNHTTTFGPTGRQYNLFTATAGNVVDAWVGLSSDQWLGLFSQTGQSALFHYNEASPGMCFIGETSVVTHAGQLDGCIIDHKWGIGSGWSTPIPPPSTLSILDNGAGHTTLWIQATAGQGGAYLQDMRDTTGNQLSGIDNTGKWKGATESFGGSVSITGCGATSIVGGATAGKYHTTGGTCAVTMGTAAGASVSATNGWACTANTLAGTAIPVVSFSATSVTMVVAGAQTVTFGCIGF